MTNKYYQILNDRRALWSSIVGQKKGGEEVFGYWYEDYFFDDGTWTAPPGTIEGSVRVHGIGGGAPGITGTPEAPGQGGRGGHYTWLNLPNGTYTFTGPGTSTGSDPIVIGSIFRASGGTEDVSTCIPSRNAISGGDGYTGVDSTGGRGGLGASPIGNGNFPGGYSSRLFGGGGQGGNTGSSTVESGYQGLIWFEYKKQSPELPKLPKFIGIASGNSFGTVWSMRPDVNNLNSKQERILPSQLSTWSSVCYAEDKGLFVAVASSGTRRVMTSPDGITWTARTPPSGGTWRSVCYAEDKGLFVAVSDASANQIITSTDGITWTTRTPPSSISNLRSVCYAEDKGLFVAIGSNGNIRSTNGVSWTQGGLTSINNWQSVTYGGGWFVAVASSGGNNSRLNRSQDGITWTANPYAPQSRLQLYTIAYGGGVFIALGGTGIMIRGNIISTSFVTVPPYNWRNITYGDGVWVATTNDSMFLRTSSNYRNYRTMFSTDNGLTWHLTDAIMGANALCYAPED